MMKLSRIFLMAGIIALLAIAVLLTPFISSFATDSIQAMLNRPPEPGPISHYPMAFKHIGIGDLNTCTSAQYPMIERTEQDQGVTTFIVKASIPCGFEVRNPSHYVQDGTLNLSYEAHFTGNADMCNCEYKSVFALANLPPDTTKVEFSSKFVDSAP
jgi:hypothetical protein